jgi:hypothetical protein
LNIFETPVLGAVANCLKSLVEENVAKSNAEVSNELVDGFVQLDHAVSESRLSVAEKVLVENEDHNVGLAAAVLVI